ncbi:MAG: adenylyl-sulfate kinase [Acidimicrobiales bacterium]
MSSNVTWHPGKVTRAERAVVTGSEGATLWLTGLSGSGKSTLAAAVEHRLVLGGRGAYRLDGDNLRSGLNGDLGFSRDARDENCRRVAEVARLFADAGLVAVVAIISPYEASRRKARQIHAEAGLRFLEVYLAASADTCASRDPKGLYAAASAGRIGSFTGVDDPYEVPESPDLVIDAEVALPLAVDLVLDALERTAAPLAADDPEG